MKKLIFSLLAAFAGMAQSQAQLSLTCENSASTQSASNNKNYDIANCWAFGGISYQSTNVLNGVWSMQTGQVTSLSTNSFWIKSPWLQPGSGNITLRTRLSAANGTSRSVVFQYIPYDAGQSNFEGTAVTFDTYNWSVINTGDNNISFAVPSAIANSTQPYKIKVSFIGSGGNSRIIADNLVIPGTYYANPSDNCKPLVVIADADADGVADANDAYPNDATRAYNNWYPAAGYGTLMFEDLWPATGDYDFNDLVVDYRYNLVTNANNKVVEMKAKFVTRAIGASFHNGFAFQLNNLASAKILSVTGANYHAAPWLNNAASGVENGQTYANIIVFDDAQKVLPSPGGSGTNIIPANPRVAPDTTSITATFTTASGQAVGVSDFTFNPYIIIDQTRGKELHLPNYVPSDKVNAAYFGQNQDDSKPASGKYYKTANNLPWALNVSSSIPYTHTTNDFITGYLKFVEWAQSNGSLYTDWYINNPGYRDGTKLFVP